LLAAASYTSPGLAEFGVGFGLYFDGLQRWCYLAVALTILSIPTWYTASNFGGDKSTLACSLGQPVCLDEGCTNWAMHSVCHLNFSMALADMVGTLLCLALVIADRTRRPTVAAALTAATQRADTKGSENEPHGVQSGMVEGICGSTNDGRAVNVDSYSVWVEDPPGNAVDLVEWKAYFESRFGEVVYVTRANPNKPLLDLLLLRRRLLQSLLIAGSPVAKRVSVADDADGFYEDSPDSRRGQSNKSGVGGGQRNAARTSRELRGSKVWVSPNGHKLQRDAPWRTGAHAQQAQILSPSQVQKPATNPPATAAKLCAFS